MLENADTHTQRIKASIFQCNVTIIRSSAFYSVHCLGCYNLLGISYRPGEKAIWRRKQTKAGLPCSQSLSPAKHAVACSMPWPQHLVAPGRRAPWLKNMASRQNMWATEHQQPCVPTVGKTSWPIFAKVYGCYGVLIAYMKLASCLPRAKCTHL